MIENANTPAVGREPKHMDLHQSIQQISDISMRLDGLITRIQGPVPCNPGDCAPDAAPPTLSQILENGGNEIRSKLSKINDQISEIENILF